MSASYPLKWIALYIEPHAAINYKHFATIFYKKEVMNSAQYHEEDFFVQVKNRDDKILPFQLQLSSIALLFAICSIYLSPLTGMFKFKFQVSNRFIVL